MPNIYLCLVFYLPVVDFLGLLLPMVNDASPYTIKSFAGYATLLQVLNFTYFRFTKFLSLIYFFNNYFLLNFTYFYFLF
jgi:hypothetical protein